ncbi:hypothetical protein [Nonomuraea jabiensis]|uniref:Uncharacterized protein n=1 Tax=Nonomuraea jabiensis TaxID=882448 RepID=A0A7W9LIQ0_9ACTN|nr:hypothetical protein [Nonomuraea jabiensis]MBB5785291.1 hypothetical protein [Nonomuraea jabiensis]
MKPLDDEGDAEEQEEEGDVREGDSDGEGEGEGAAVVGLESSEVEGGMGLGGGVVAGVVEWLVVIGP